MRQGVKWVLRLRRELQKSYQKSRGWEEKLVASDALHVIKYRGLVKAARAAKGTHLFPPAVTSKWLGRRERFGRYCAVYRIFWPSQSDFTPSGPWEAWAVRPACSVSQGRAAAGHSIFKQCVHTKAEHLWTSADRWQHTAKVRRAAGVPHLVHRTGITNTSLIWEISKDPPLFWANVFSA